MKIYIPFDYSYIGGPRTFLDNLKIYLDKRNVCYTTNITEADSTFFPNVIFDMSALKQIRAKGGKVVQRLDGVTYPSMHGINYEDQFHSKEIKDIYLNYTDFIVFQSEYSKAQCFEMYGTKEENEYEIIVNGVNKDIFRPSNTPFSKDGIIKFVTSGNFRKKDLIEPLVSALDLLKGKYQFELHTIGNITNPDIEEYFKRDYIIRHPHTELEGVSELLSESHIFLFSNINAPCPNSVVEAISAALPVVSFNTGAMKELVSFSTELLTYVSEDIFQEYKDYNFSEYAKKIELCINNYEKYKKLALDNSDRYSFEECGSKYVDVFEKVMGPNIFKRNLLKRLFQQ